MGKVSKKKSRRDNRGGRRSNNDLEQSNKKQSAENSSIILTDLNSMDVKKRTTAIIMFKDLLMQNLNNLNAVTKLTTNEILSSLSLRLIDSNSGIRLEAVKCFLAVIRCGAKFAERIIDLGIHQTILKMLEEVSSSSSSSDDEVVDDLLCILHLISSHCPHAYSSSSSSLASLAFANLSPHIMDSRRISFAEYLLNSSTNSSLVISQEIVWVNLYLELSPLVLDKHLSKDQESLSNYFLVLLCSVMANLLCTLPSIPKSEQLTWHVIWILTGSLHLQQSSPSIPSQCVDDMVIESDQSTLPTSALAPTPSEEDRAVDMGRYKTLCLKTSADTLTRLYTERERTLDCDSTSSKQAARAGPPPVDFKKAVNKLFNAFFEACLSSSKVLAVCTTKIKSETAGGRAAAGAGAVLAPAGSEASTAGTDRDSVSEEGESNTHDVLEAFLSSLCAAADYGTADLEESTVSRSMADITQVIEVLYASLCLALAADTGDAEAEVDGGKEDTERLRFLTTSACSCLSSLVQHAPPSALRPLTQTQIGGEGGHTQVQRMALILCRCASCPDPDVSIPSISTMGSLGAKNDQLEAAGGGVFLLPKINWLLSNSILRVLDGFRDSQGEPEENIFLLEICHSSFIDLHSSDDKDILQNFIKLKAIEKLGASLCVFEGAVEAVTRQGSADAGNDLQAALSDFEETILNTHSFLEYKANYCK